MNSFQYYSPKSVRETLNILDRCGENTYILAGGTDFIVKMRKK
ncbi:FAD binding domain-containing protein [Clostridium pasteurianum]|nr:FAD binding domain-containing protein [Clostridium pasteurianum]